MWLTPSGDSISGFSPYGGGSLRQSYPSVDCNIHTSDSTTGCLMDVPKRSELVKHSDVADGNVVFKTLRLIKRAREERARSTNLKPHAPTENSVGGS